MEFKSEHNESLWRGNPHTAREASKILCQASIAWFDGEIYRCERTDPHNGEERMHGSTVASEWTNWTDSFLAANPEYLPS